MKRKNQIIPSDSETPPCAGEVHLEGDLAVGAGASSSETSPCTVGGEGSIRTYEERAKREQLAWNKGIDRRLFDRVFGLAGNEYYFYYYERDRTEFVKTMLMPSKAMSLLEIGDRAWKSWWKKHKIDTEKITCINISRAEIDGARSEPNPSPSPQQPSYVLMDAHLLGFKDAAFDVVYGLSILHHLDYSVALPEIKRVLKDGGKILFREPLAMNPIAKLIRKLTPSLRTRDEKPLDQADIDKLSMHFECTLLYEELFSIIGSTFFRWILKNPQNIVMRMFFHLDKSVMNIFPKICPYARMVTIIGRKPVSR